MQKQKNEWAEIYGSMKQEIETLKLENRQLQGEADRILKQFEGRGSERELAKKLKKRELECQALWDTLKDMQGAGKNVFDVRQMGDLLAVRALDTKAKRKLKQ